MIEDFMSREKIKSKYGMSMQHKDHELGSWKESDAVLRLSEFIQANRRHGIYIIMKDGRPALHFNPGLRRGNKERWDAALKAEVLYAAAVDDLVRLIQQNKIELPDRASCPSAPIEIRVSEQMNLGWK